MRRNATHAHSAHIRASTSNIVPCTSVCASYNIRYVTRSSQESINTVQAPTCSALPHARAYHSHCLLIPCCSGSPGCAPIRITIIVASDAPLHCPNCNSGRLPCGCGWSPRLSLCAGEGRHTFIRSGGPEMGGGVCGAGISLRDGRRYVGWVDAGDLK